jgi:hypothetical protein
MLFSRLVVLLNLPEPYTHGEARLFDPDGKIRKTIYQDRYLKYINARHDINFLGKMKHEFYNTFGAYSKYCHSFSLSSMPYYDFQKNTKHDNTKRSIALYALSQIHIEPVNTNVLGQYRVKSVRT